MAMFAISGSNVVLARDLASTDDGTVSYVVTATENGVSVMATGTLMITAAVVPQTPTAVALASPSASLPDNSLANATVSGFSVTTSDGQPFAGTVSVSGPA